jgi:hypothetical protein
VQQRYLFFAIGKKRMDGPWSQAINLKKFLNFKNSANCAIVTRDGKHLFFLDIYEGKYQRYWISAGFIDRLRELVPPTTTWLP